MRKDLPLSFKNLIDSTPCSLSHFKGIFHGNLTIGLFQNVPDDVGRDNVILQLNCQREKTITCQSIKYSFGTVQIMNNDS